MVEATFWVTTLSRTAVSSIIRSTAKAVRRVAPPTGPPALSCPRSPGPDIVGPPPPPLPLAGLSVPAVPVPDHAGQHPLDIAGREPRQPDATELGKDVLPHDDAVELDGRRLPVRGQQRASPPPLPVRLHGRGPLAGGLVTL